MRQHKRISDQLKSVIKDHQKRRLGLAFCAPSGTGKTTFLCSVIEELLLEETIEHSDFGIIKMSHHQIASDTTHKDCQHYRNLGVEVLATNCIEEAKLFLQAMVAKKKICLIEGGRRLNISSVVLEREGFVDKNWIPPKNIVLSLKLNS